MKEACARLDSGSPARALRPVEAAGSTGGGSGQHEMSIRSITCPTCCHGFAVPADARTAICPRCGRALPILPARLGFLGAEVGGRHRPEEFEDLPSTAPGLPRRAPATNAEPADPTLPDPPRAAPNAATAPGLPVAIAGFGTGVDRPARPPGVGAASSSEPPLAEQATAEELCETAVDWQLERRAAGKGDPASLSPLELAACLEPASAELPDDPTVPFPSSARSAGSPPRPRGPASIFHRDLTPSARLRVLSSAIEDEVGKAEDLAGPLFPPLETRPPSPAAPSESARASAPLQASPSSPVAVIDTPPTGSSPTLPRGGGVRAAAPVPDVPAGATGRQSGGIAVVLPASPVEEVPLPRETAGEGRQGKPGWKESAPSRWRGLRRRRWHDREPEASTGLAKLSALLLAGAAVALLLGLLAWLLLR